MKPVIDDLVDALFRSRSVDQFVVVEEESETVEIERLESVSGKRVTTEAHGRDHAIELALFRDLENGRGSVRVRLDDPRVASENRSWRDMIAEWSERASASLEPSWSLPLPSAPARVRVADPEIANDLHGGATRVVRDLESLVVTGARPPVTLGHARATCRASRVEVRNSHDFRYGYRTTLVRAAFSLAHPRGAGHDPGSASGPGVEELRTSARRVTDLRLAELVDRGRRSLPDRMRARPTPPGEYDLVLVHQALTPERVSLTSVQEQDTSIGYGSSAPARYGWFAPFVAQADSRWARHGLTRYQPGQPILGTRRHIERSRGDALTLVSDNTIPFGLHSRPVGELGAPIRRFHLVQGGVARGLSLDQREAALRGVSANGGIGNLGISPGPTTARELTRTDGRPVLLASALDHLHIDARNGAFLASIGLAYLVPPGPPASPGPTTSPQATAGGALLDLASLGQPVAGGVFRGNVFDLFSDVRLSSEVETTGWYHGPRAIRFSRLSVS